MSSFTKQEIAAFDKLVVGFKEMNIATNLLTEVNLDPVIVQQSFKSGVVRPMPYIARSFLGTDMSSNFGAYTQLSVPVTVNTQRSVPVEFEPNELIDDLQLTRIMDSAKQKLASDLEGDVLNVLVNQGTRVIKRTTSATGFDDTIAAAALMDDVGIEYNPRYFLYNSTDYQNAASNLAGRSTISGLVQTAYTEGTVSKINGFSAYQVPRMPVLTAATATGVTVNGANQYYTPVSTSAGTNVDARYQNLNITVTSGTVKVGDCFTIANVFDRSMQSKQILGSLKTFRVTAIVSGAGGSGTITISPPIISGGGNTTAELQYQNASATPANGAAITFLNTVSRQVCPFFFGGAVELIPGRIYQPDAGMGVAFMQASIGNDVNKGLQLCMQKAYAIGTTKVQTRVDVRYGVAMTGPEHCGIVLFNQT